MQLSKASRNTVAFSDLLVLLPSVITGLSFAAANLFSGQENPFLCRDIIKIFFQPQLLKCY